MRLAYFDLVGGAAGDMLLGALIDAGAPLDDLRGHLARLDLGPWRLDVRHEDRRSLRAARVEVVVPDAAPQPHRHLADVLAVIDGAALPPRAAGWARRAFEALAEAEGRVHGIPAEEVHFHEVGAVDSIVDTVGVALALDLLGVERVESSPLPLCGGEVEAAHGRLPLPAPAVLHLAAACGVAVAGRPGRGELVTPTAAALLGTLAASFGPWPAMTVERVGLGAGRRVAPDDAPPNVTRVVLGRAGPEDGTPREVVVLEAALDDQPGELSAWLLEALLRGGALDAYLTPVHMKKGRPGTLVTVLAEPARAGALSDVLLRESATLGVRWRAERRLVLEREAVEVQTPFGAVRVKVARRPDGTRTCAPEYEDCARAARAAGAPLREVYRAAQRAAEER